MKGTLQDFRYAIRILARHRPVSILSGLTLALAIGLSTALFSVIDASLIRPLPLPDSRQLVECSVRTSFGNRMVNASPTIGEMRSWQASGAFTSLAGWTDVSWGSIVDGPPERVATREVTEGYLTLHSAAPALGRGFDVSDMSVAAPPVVMLADAYWRTRFGGSASAVGQLLRYDDVTATIVGVLPAGFYPEIKLWRPVRLDAGEIDTRRAFVVYGVLRPGLTIADAEGRVGAMVSPEASAPGNSKAASQIKLKSVLEETASNARTMLMIITGAVALVLLLACVNAAGLLIVSGSSRRNELAIRASMGASRTRLIRQVLIECLLLSFAAGVVGSLVAWVSLDTLMAILPVALPKGTSATISLPVLLAGALLSIITGIAFGLVPALVVTRADPGAVLARDSRRLGLSLSRRTGQILIGTEVALSLVLLVAAGLLLKSFALLTSVDLGFNPATISAFKAVPLEPSAAVHADFYPRALHAIQALPGVASAGSADHFVLSDTNLTRPVRAGDVTVPMGIRQVLPGYFETLQLRATYGRYPSWHGPVPMATAAVANEAAARALFPSGAIGDVRVANRAFTVIGVVPDFIHGGPLGAHRPELFIPYEATDSRLQLALGMTFVVKPQPGSGSNLARELKRTVESIGPRVLVEEVRSGTDWVGDRVVIQRHRAAVLGLLAVLGLTLTLIGVFGSTSRAVGQRAHEIGIRMALGARPSQLVLSILRDATWPVLVGLFVGCVAAYFATRVLGAFLFNTTPHDLSTFVFVSGGVVATALISAFIPARRAALIDPVRTLRSE